MDAKTGSIGKMIKTMITVSKLIKELQRLQKRVGDKEVRLGEYGGGSSEADGAYYDDNDSDAIIIH